MKNKMILERKIRKIVSVIKVLDEADYEDCCGGIDFMLPVFG